MNNRFAQRSDQLELMDDFSCSGETINNTLIEIDLINKWLGGNPVTVHGIRTLLRNRTKSNSTLSIADLGCGSGAMLKLINAWAEQNEYKVLLTGIDANHNIIAFAKEHLKGSRNVNLLSLDILSDEFKELKFDVVTGTLFFHHLSTEQLISFFRQLKEQVKIGIVINDIHRHWLAYHSIRLITKYFSRSPMVKFDAPLSVLRSFSKKELINILNKAGINDFAIRWCWAFRWQVIIKA